MLRPRSVGSGHPGTRRASAAAALSVARGRSSGRWRLSSRSGGAALWEAPFVAAGLLRRSDTLWGSGVEPAFPALGLALRATLPEAAARQLRQDLGSRLAALSAHPRQSWQAYRLLAGRSGGDHRPAGRRLPARRPTSRPSRILPAFHVRAGACAAGGARPPG